MNLLLLFFLSLIPFATAYAGETGFATFPTSLYALVMLLPALTWNWLAQTLSQPSIRASAK